jgi:hypothetical protein
MAKIRVEGIGDIEIQDRDMWATEETMALIAAKLKAIPQITKADNKTQEQTNKNLKEQNTQIRFYNRHMFDNIKSVRMAKIAFDNLAMAIDGSMGIVRGIMNVTGKMSDLNFAIDMGTNAITRFTDMVPIVGAFLTSLVEAKAEILKMKLAFIDLTGDTFSELSRMGVSASEEMDSMIKNFIDTGATLEVMKATVQENAEVITRFGGTAEAGIKQFTQNIDSLTDKDSGLGMGLRVLGLNAQTIAESMADFYQINRRNMDFGRLTQPQLNEQLSQRIRNERILTELTGIQVDEQRQKAMEMASSAGIQAAMMGLDSETRNQLTTLFDGLDPIARQFAGEILAFGGPVNEITAQFSALAPEVAEQIKAAVGAISNGAPSTTYIARISQAYADNVEAMAGTAKLTLLSNANFESMAESFLRAQDQSIQLQALQAQGFDTFEEFEKQLSQLGKAQQDEISALMQDEKLTDKEKRLRLGEIVDNEKLANVIFNRMKVEQAGAETQAEIFNTLMSNFDSLSDTTGELIEALGKYAEKVVNFFDSQEQEAETYNYGGGSVGEMKAKLATAHGVDDKVSNDFSIKTNKQQSVKNNFMGGQLFPGMLSMVGELGPELISMGNSMGEVINDKTTSDIMGAAQGIVQALKADVGAGGDLMSGTGLSKTMSAIESSAPMLESSMAKLGGDMQQQSVDLLTRIANDNADIKKLMNRILPKAMSGNGYF